MITYHQQGDCLLKQVDKVTGKKLNANLLYKGQQHHHRVRGKFSIYKDGETTYLKSAGCILYHEEHKENKIPKGNYILDIVQEYDHWLEESRKVID